ncbi:MAG: flippase-like domain-containing protein [Chloroflexi bacterium]|nr:flippase-like domain-containing protein [Chloroflexota bacterium]
MRKVWMNLLRVLISVGALAFLFWNVGLSDTVNVLLQASLRYLLAAFALFVLSMVIRAARWYVLLRGLDATVSFWRLLRLYFVGQFFNSFLPTSFGGDVVRAVELTQDTDPSDAIGTVILDRMTGLLVLFAMGLAVLPFYASALEPWLVRTLLLVSCVGLAGGALVLEGRVLRRITRYLPARISLAGQGTLAKVYAAVTGCGWRAIGGAFMVSLIFNIVNVFINWLCGRAVGAHAGVGYFFAVTPLISVSLLIPSIGGWGVREAVSTAVFAPARIEASVAAALGIAMGGVALATGLVGGLVYLGESLYHMWDRSRPV